MGKNGKKNKLTGPRAGGDKVWAGRTVLCCGRSTGTQGGGNTHPGTQFWSAFRILYNMYLHVVFEEMEAPDFI